MATLSPIVARLVENRAQDAVRRIIRFDDREVFFEVSGGVLPPPLQLHDFAVPALIFTAMRQRRPLHIDGAVSAELMRNSEEFQEAWSAWRPDSYTPVPVTAEQVGQDVHPPQERLGVFAFSGGVDGTFALLRHLKGQAGQRAIRPLGAMLVHGFDIPLANADAFGAAHGAATAVMGDLDLPLYIVRSNWKQAICSDWEMEFFTGVAACLYQFTGFASHGVLGADEDYAHLSLPWGSNPVTNHFLCGGAFQIHTEGGGFTRTQRVALIAQTPQIARQLRVCWEGPVTGRNCGVCEKCIRTKMNFMANGNEPLCFDRPPTLAEIRGVNAKNAVQIAYLKDIREVAAALGNKEAWVSALSTAIRKNELLLPFRPAIQRVRKRIRRVKNRLTSLPSAPTKS